MQTPTPLPPIRFADLAAALLRDVEHLLVQWLPNGVRKNHEYVCGSLAGGAGTSCSVNLNTGQWADFSTGEQGGDLLSLYAVANGLTMGKAAAQVARENGLEDVAGLVRTGAPGSVPPIKPRPPAPPPKPVVAYNELSNSIQARRPWPWRYGTAGDVTDTVDLLLGKYMTDNYGLPSIPRAALSEAIQTVAHTERFHPIREYLQGLKWDGNPRLDKWLVHAIGETPTSLGPALTEYLKLVGRYWLLGMVYRVMQPGCKFDYCPVLEGSGGLRKSTLVEVLASSEFFSDTKFDVSKGKEAQEQVQGVWLYEIAELAHFGRSEVSDIKAFISSKTDRYRVAYGTTVSSFPRQCVLAGTTNEKTYLQDRSGNRRFWPIPVRHVINTEWVSKYRDQLMAEAFVQQQQGACYTPTKDDEDRLFEPMQESRLVDTAVLGELLHVLTRPPQPTGSGVLVNELAEFVTMPDLVRALDVDPGKSTAGLEKQIRTWMVHEGWIYGKRQVGCVRKSGYARPANWPQQEVVPVDTPLDVSIPGGLPGDDVPF